MPVDALLSPAALELKPGLHFPPLDKIQYLTDSLQRITGDLNRVLSLMSAFSQQQSPLFLPAQDPMAPLPRGGIPLSAYSCMARAQSAAPVEPTSAGHKWAWRTRLAPVLSASAGHSVDHMLMEKWQKYFPGEKFCSLILVKKFISPFNAKTIAQVADRPLESRGKVPQPANTLNGT